MWGLGLFVTTVMVIPATIYQIILLLKYHAILSHRGWIRLTKEWYVYLSLTVLVQVFTGLVWIIGLEV